MNEVGQSFPKVTQEDIDHEIVSVTFLTGNQGPLMSDQRASWTSLLPPTVTICNITLDNGFSVRGESACVSLENFNFEKGKELSRKDAMHKLWMLFGFRLADKLHRAKKNEETLKRENDRVADTFGGEKQPSRCVYSFSNVLHKLRMNRTFVARRPTWAAGSYITVDFRGPTLKMMLPLDKSFLAYTPSNEDMFATDWLVGGLGIIDA